MTDLAVAISGLIGTLAPLIGKAMSAKEEQHADIINEAAQAFADFEATMNSLTTTLSQHDKMIDAELAAEKP